MKDLEEAYRICLSELHENSQVLINMNQISSDFTVISDRFFKRKYENLKEDFGIIISENYKQYLQFSEISIEWESKLEKVDYVLTGGFEMNNLLDALDYYSDFWKGAFSLAPNETVPYNLKHFEQLGWFSRQAWDDGRYGCFIKQPGNFPPPIAFYSRGWYVKLDMTFEEYLENMFKMYGAKGWQFFFIEPTNDMTYKEDILEDMRVITEQFPLLFPENDWTFLSEKYEKYKKEFN